MIDHTHVIYTVALKDDELKDCIDVINTNILLRVKGEMEQEKAQPSELFDFYYGDWFVLHGCGHEDWIGDDPQQDIISRKWVSFRDDWRSFRAQLNENWNWVLQEIKPQVVSEISKMNGVHHCFVYWNDDITFYVRIRNNEMFLCNFNSDVELFITAERMNALFQHAFNCKNFCSSEANYE